MLVKICGITNAEDAQASLDAGADWIGLNLVAGPRRIDPDLAQRILSNLADASRAVALVHLEGGRLCAGLRSMLCAGGVRRVQPYGEIPPEAIRRFADDGLEVIFVQPVAEEASMGSLDAFLDSCGETRPSYVLFDAGTANRRQALNESTHRARTDLLPGRQGDLAEAQAAPTADGRPGAERGPLGGTGRRANWPAIATARRAGRFASWPPVLLAGGLTPVNVAEAIATVSPVGVDVSSGVETSPGRKDHAKIEALVVAARARPSRGLPPGR